MPRKLATRFHLFSYHTVFVTSHSQLIRSISLWIGCPVHAEDFFGDCLYQAKNMALHAASTPFYFFISGEHAEYCSKVPLKYLFLIAGGTALSHKI